MSRELTANEPAFRNCPGCGSPTPAGDSVCVHCGRLSIDAAAGEHKAVSERRFLQALFTRSNPFTMVLIGMNVGVFALMCLAGGIAVTSVDPAVLIGFGAKQNTLIAEQHEYWRLVTSMFIHIGFVHLFLNNYALWIIGQEIERIYGSARFLVLYLATGVLGSLGSYAFNPQATSAGASGAIFGLFGVIATFAFKYRREIPDLLSREIKRRVLPIIAINLLFGFSVRIVDNAAHIGGLLSGIALALTVPYKRPNERTTPLVWRALQVVCLAVIFISFADAFRSYNGPRLSFSNLITSPGSSVVTYFERMKDGRLALEQSMNSFRSGTRVSKEPAASGAATGFVERGIRAVNSITQSDPQANRYRDRLRDLLNDQMKVLDQSAEANAATWDKVRQREDALTDAYNQFSSDYDGWLPGFLKEHGYELRGSDRH